jgi:hypothetical protein
MGKPGHLLARLPILAERPRPGVASLEAWPVTGLCGVSTTGPTGPVLRECISRCYPRRWQRRG